MESHISGCGMKSRRILWFFRCSLSGRGPGKGTAAICLRDSQKIAVFHSPKAGFVLARFRVPGKALVWPSCPEEGRVLSISCVIEGTRLDLRKPWAWPLWEILLFLPCSSLLSCSSDRRLVCEGREGRLMESQKLRSGNDFRNPYQLLLEQCFFLPLASALYLNSDRMLR